MNNDMLDQLTSDIIRNTDELHDLTKLIKELDEDIVKSETEENKLFMLETIDRYKALVDQTKILLEAFFEEERQSDKPADFLFRRLYRKIQKAY